MSSDISIGADNVLRDIFSLGKDLLFVSWIDNRG
jgi:hypothetical protein